MNKAKRDIIRAAFGAHIVPVVLEDFGANQDALDLAWVKWVAKFLEERLVNDAEALELLSHFPNMNAFANPKRQGPCKDPKCAACSASRELEALN